MYAVNVERRVVFCNAALAEWLGLEPEQIVGRIVEYHSEGAGTRDGRDEANTPLADLCPPPKALRGVSCTGTIACMARDGRLVHRQAEFVPLANSAVTRPDDDAKKPISADGNGVLVLLSESDLSPQRLAAELSDEPTADELHRTIRQFRRAEAAHYRIDSLLGQSAAMRKVRAQLLAAAESSSNALLHGPRGSGRKQVARAIHYHANEDLSAKLVAVDCELLNDDLLRRALDSLGAANTTSRERTTLLLENLESLSSAHQSLLLSAVRENQLTARILATYSGQLNYINETSPITLVQQSGYSNATADGESIARAAVDPDLLNEISTITIRIPSLVQRLEDLPLLAQCFLEACNRGSAKQVGSIRPEALDQLALHSWPGELVELREVIAAAHAACTSTVITPSDLPAVIHHAARAASHARRPPPSPIVLDELLVHIEREAILRAMAQAGGNKSEAAQLLGMTRPRLYRRLVQLGLVQESPFDSAKELPEFIEQDSVEESP